MKNDSFRYSKKNPLGYPTTFKLFKDNVFRKSDDEEA